MTMDRVLLRPKTEEHKDLVLRMDRYLVRRFGLARNSVYLKVGDYYLNCVPFEISLASCRAIAVFERKEIEYFSDYVGGMYNLHLTIEHEGFSKPLSLFLKVRLECFEQHNPESNVCIINMKNITVPNDFLEVFVGVADEYSAVRALYDDEYGSVPVDLKTFRSTLGSPYFTVRTDADATIAGKSTRVSSRQIQLFLDLEEVELAPGARVDIEFTPLQALVSGTVSEIKESAETTGFAFVTVDLQFSQSYLAIVRKLLPSS